MEQLNYHDFEVEIAPGDGTRYPVAVLRSPSGQARTTMRFPFDRATLDRQLGALENALLGASGDGAAGPVRRFGLQLFDLLIRDDVRSVYDMSRQATLANGHGLRIKLRVNAPELATIPWEFLYDPRQAEFVALSRHTPILRYLELPLPDAELAVTPPLRILGMLASPDGVLPLEVGREKARLEDAVRGLQEIGLVELTWLEGQTWRDLHAAMQGGPWHIFHFVGHAVYDEEAGEGLLLLADDSGEALPLSATQLGRLLADHRTLRLALLNACEGARGHEQSLFSSAASLLVRRGMPAVLAMQYGITDEAAIEFARSFYSALAVGLPVDAALSEARKAISLAVPGSMEWGTPVLFMRAPDGVIWEVEKEETEMGTDEGQNWWDRLPDTIGDFTAGDIEGDVIIATVGAGARNVAVGKNITQAIYGALGEPRPDDRQVIQAGVAQVKAALEHAAGEIGESAASMAQGMLIQIENELLKSGEHETPNAATITHMGDLLLDSVPQITQALAGLFATPAVGRALGKADEAAVKWVKQRFANAPIDETGL
jgi:hypothetical protein